MRKNPLYIKVIFFILLYFFLSFAFFSHKNIANAITPIELQALENKLKLNKIKQGMIQSDPQFLNLKKLYDSYKWKKFRSESERDADDLYVKDEVIIKYKKNIFDLSKTELYRKEENFLSEGKLELIKRNKEFNISLVKIKDGKTVEEKIKDLSNNITIESVQPNYIYHNLSIDSNDPYKTHLWGLDNYGQIVNGNVGLNDKDIDAPEAWNILKRNENKVIVAVIDNGINYYMSDIELSMWDGSNCVNEQNEPILGGCKHGYDYTEYDNEPLPDWGESHGTHIAGTIAAQFNNGVGILGVAPNVEIMALKMSYNTTFSVINGIGFAKYNNAKIINASWGGPNYDQALKDAIESFPGLFVVAAGNDAKNHDAGQNIYPCDYELDNIICVAATTSRDELAGFSDYGAISVDLGAPGVNILSTVTDSKLSENFNNIYLGSIPSGWSRSGYGSSWWGVAKHPFDDYEKVLCTDRYACRNYYYDSWMNSTLTSAKYDMSKTDAGALIFDIACDTEYSPNNLTDVLILEISQNGYDYEIIGVYDEAILDDDSDSTGYAVDSVFMPIPPEYYTTNFQFRFTWLTNGVDNSHGGCYIDNLDLARGGYAFFEGTSMAAPHVSGVAALLWGYRPNLTTAQVKEAIMNSGDPVPALAGKAVSGKRLNANNALLAVQGEVIKTFSFSIEGVSHSCSVNEKTKKILCNLPADYPKSNLAPSIELTGGSISPASGVARDFTIPQNYTFTHTDDVQEIYTVIITPFLRGNTLLRSGAGNWSVPNTKFVTEGDFNGDGKDDVAVMYDYDREDMSLIMFLSDGTKFPGFGKTWFRSGVGNWSVPNTRFVTSGDFNGNGIDELTTMYDYGNADMSLITFR